MEARDRAADFRAFHAGFFDEPASWHAVLAGFHSFFLLEHFNNILRRDRIHKEAARGFHVLQMPLLTLGDRLIGELCAFQLYPSLL